MTQYYDPTGQIQNNSSTDEYGWGIPTNDPSGQHSGTRTQGESGYQDPYAPGKQAPPAPSGNVYLPKPVKPTAPQTPPLPPTPPPLPPIPTQGGKVNYQPTEAPYGYDMSMPGVMEQFWNNNQGMWFNSPSMDWVDSQLSQFQDPWEGERSASQLLGSAMQHWNGVDGGFNTSSNSSRGGSLQPQFDAYYDRMKDKAISDVNTQAAARGSYGSNAALNGSIGAGLDVEAMRAKAATDFSLADSENQRLWQLTNDNHLKNLSDLAFGLDDSRRNRLDSGISTAFGSHYGHQSQLQNAFGAAGEAQNAREGRVGGLYNNVSDFSGDAMSFFATNYDQLLGADAATLDSILQTMLAETADQRGWNQQQQERIFRDVKTIIDVVKDKETADVAKGG